MIEEKTGRSIPLDNFERKSQTGHMSAKSIRLWGGLAFVASWLVVGLNAHAAITGTDSIEWRTCRAGIVAVGRISEVRTTVWRSVLYEDCVLEVTENIKGSALKQIPFTFRHVTDKQVKWHYPKGEVLVFLSVWEDRSTDEQIAAGHYSDPHDETRLHKRHVPLGGGKIPERHPIISLTDPIEAVFDREMNPVKDKDALLALSEDRFRSRYLQMAKSTEASERMEAAANLWKFPGAESETALRLLLDDKTESISASVADSIAAIEYAIRSCAYRGLKHLGKVVPEHIVLKRPPTAEEQKSYRLDYWKSRFKRVERAVESIEILETRTLKGEGESVSILARLDVGASHLSVIIVPYSWQVKKLPEAELIGYDSDFRQRDTCVYFVKGTSAKEHIDLVRRLFGIRPPAR
jgi:hypothetical protein